MKCGFRPECGPTEILTYTMSQYLFTKRSSQTLAAIHVPHASISRMITKFPNHTILEGETRHVEMREHPKAIANATQCAVDQIV